MVEVVSERVREDLLDRELFKAETAGTLALQIQRLIALRAEMSRSQTLIAEELLNAVESATCVIRRARSRASRLGVVILARYFAAASHLQ
jgi:hypothetical protein